MSKGRRCRRCCGLVVALAPLAAFAGGCASVLNSSSTGFVDLEPAKPTDGKSAKAKNNSETSAASSTAQGVSLTRNPADVGPLFDATERDQHTFVSSAPPVGSGFPPFLPAQSGASTNDLGELAAELRAAGVLSPAEQRALLDDLRQTDPALWPKLVHQFRLALAYRSRGQGSGVGGQGYEATLATASADRASIGKDGVSNADVTAGSTGTHTDKSDLGPPDEPRATRVANDVLALSEPALRPPRKSAEKKIDEKNAVNKPSECDKSKALTQGSAEPVTAADSPLSGESQLQLTKAILAVEGDASHPAAGATAAELGRQMQLRMLYLAAGRRDDALRPIPGLSNAQQDFWTKEIYGLATYLDQERSGASDHSAGGDRRAAEAALHLRDAADRLGELAPPAVRNLAFCKEVTSFGVFKKFPKYEFKPGDEALLYCEIENLKSESTDKGFRTSVKGRYEILDSRGERAAEQEFPASDDYCSRPRRDFFIPYFVSIPKRIGEGEYTLKLTVEDAQAQKTGQGSIQFSVK